MRHERRLLEQERGRAAEERKLAAERIVAGEAAALRTAIERYSDRRGWWRRVFHCGLGAAGEHFGGPFGRRRFAPAPVRHRCGAPRPGRQGRAPD